MSTEVALRHTHAEVSHTQAGVGAPWNPDPDVLVLSQNDRQVDLVV
jgi:hypothetical protein